MRRVRWLGVAIVAWFLGCAAAPPVAPPVAPPMPVAPVAAVAVTASPALPPLPPSGPPPRITAVRPGDPDASELAGARLAPETCHELDAETDAAMRDEIAGMRREVDANLESWKQRPACRRDEEKLSAEEARSSLMAAVGGGLSAQGLSAGGGAGSERGVEASGTNNQVAGVDEADIVKVDGEHLFLATNGALRIVDAREPRLVSETKLTGTVRELLVHGDRAAVFLSRGAPAGKACTYGYTCAVAGDRSSTTVVVLDVSDRTKPRTIREIALSGSLIAARRIGDAVHFVVTDSAGTPSYETTLTDWGSDLSWCRRNVAGVTQRFERLKRENEKKIRAVPRVPTMTEHGKARRLCEVVHSPFSDASSFTSLISFALADDTAAATTVTMMTRPGTVFASDKALYVAVPSRHAYGDERKWDALGRGRKELSEIHKLFIGGAPAETRYVGTGIVPGHVLNQLAMDEWYGYLRVASTVGHLPNPGAESFLSVLAEDPAGALVRVGAIEHLAPGEDIRAVHFDGELGYVVTFKKTDPLFVVDLHQPDAPTILGELKIPGFSTYLHRIDRTHLLSIGFDAADRGDFAFFDGLLLQLFDVTRPTEPVLLHREKIGTRGSSSAAATDHLAFNFVADRGLLAIPVTICEGGGDGRFGSTLTFSGLMVYDVSVDNGFHRRGGVDHGTHGASCRAWWSNADSLVKRSVLTRELAFSIAEDRLKVQRLDALGADVADIPLGHPVVPKAPPESSPSLIGLSAVPKPGPSGSVAVTSAVEGGTVANAAAVVAGLRAGFRSCYNAGLKVDPRMSGRVTVLATLAPNGEVASTSIAQTAGISDPVEQCVQRKLRNASFDAPVPARSPAVVRIDLAMTPP